MNALKDFYQRLWSEAHATDVPRTGTARETTGDVADGQRLAVDDDEAHEHVQGPVSMPPRVLVVSHYLPYTYTFETLHQAGKRAPSTQGDTMDDMNGHGHLHAHHDEAVIEADHGGMPGRHTSASFVQHASQKSGDDLTQITGPKTNVTDEVSQSIHPSAFMPSLGNPRLRHPSEYETLAPSFVFRPRHGHSALFAGMSSLDTGTIAAKEVLYIGWSGHCLDEEGNSQSAFAPTPEQVTALREQYYRRHQCIPVVVDPDLSAGHYEGYCKMNLWPLFHYIIWDGATDGRDETGFWNDYIAMNQKYADSVMAVYKPGDLIWIHDYHLLLVPSMIRKALPHAVIGFFLHSPFPTSEIFRCLPTRADILKGVLGSNLIGFQTYSYARHFISSCTRILGLESTPKGLDYNGHPVQIGIFPIGIDVKRITERSCGSGVLEKMETIRKLFPGKRIIIGRDKLDQIKGVVHKLNAFEKFLKHYPEWHDKVVLIQITSPGREKLYKGSQRIEQKISETVLRINGQYGSLQFTPIHHFHQIIEADEYYALLAIAELGLITSVRDGMNTTSHEFIVCQKAPHGKCAPLILSEFTGTAGSFAAAMLVNPWDYMDVASSINEALHMSQAEKQVRHRQLYDHVQYNSASFWAASFIQELIQTTETPLQSTPTPFLPFNQVIDSYVDAKKRLILLDYDGTLAPLRNVPEAAKPSAACLLALQGVTSDPNNTVFIISGRDQGALDNWLGHIPGLGFSAEHGCFIKYPDLDAAQARWINLSSDIDLNWKNDILPIFEYYTERTPGSFVEHKRASLTWHYRLADPEYGSWQAKECQNHLESAVLSKLPVEILIGKKNLEVRPVSINKGEIVKRLLAQYPETEFVFCAGDDKTDEDMFRAILNVTDAATKASSIVSPTTSVGGASTPISNPARSSRPMSPSGGTASPSNFSGINQSILPIPSPDACYACTIGNATKKTMASYHVNRPHDIIALLARFSNKSEQHLLTTNATTR